ncbi:Ig-like domain-containing protein, partial [Vibrio owensii]|uniref:Ig-like domain-containing protein n=1 Tax=Vibrio owensii TaxID=696485 RepID=UPI0040685542
MRTFILIVISIILLGCGSEDSVEYNPLESISVTYKRHMFKGGDLTVPVGYSIQFDAVGHYRDGSTKEITELVSWHSSNTTVATVNTKGLLTGESEGASSITAHLEGVQSGGVAVTVSSAV